MRIFKGGKSKNVIISTVLLFLVTAVLFSMCTKKEKLKSMDYLESSINVIEELDENSNIYVDGEIKKYYIENDTNTYFSELKLGLTDNPYSIYYLFYDYILLDEIDGNNASIASNMEYLKIAVKKAIDNEDIVALDLVSYICLQYACYGSYDTEFIEYFEDTYYDSTMELFCENVADEISKKVSFTADICNMFNIVGLKYDTSKIKKAINSYYDSTEFLDLNDNMSIFSAGGDALYAMNILGNEIDITPELKIWYNNWRKIYNIDQVSSWDDVLTIECVFRPVSDVFDEDLEYAEVDIFISKTSSIDSLINDYFEERLVYDLLKNHFGSLTEDEKGILTSTVEGLVENHIESITEVSIEATYYGMSLSYVTHNTSYNYDGIMSCILNFYNKRAASFLAKDTNITVEKIINETYYFLLLGFQYNEGTYPENIRTVVEDVLDEIKKEIKNTRDPVSLRKFCIIASQLEERFSRKEIDEVKVLYEDYIQDETIMLSYYVIDLYIVGQIMGFEELTDQNVIDKLELLKSEYCYCDFEGNVSLEATFYIYAGMASMGELGNVNNQSEKLEKEISELFEMKNGGYRPYKNSGAAELKTLFWGTCLSNI